MKSFLINYKQYLFGFFIIKIDPGRGINIDH
jgi:hypothetical protein